MPVDLIIKVMATARITRLVVEDEITEEFREWALGTFQEWPKLQYLVTCKRCVSVWAAMGVLLFWHVIPGGRWAMRMLALSEMAIAGLTGVEWLELEGSLLKEKLSES